MAIASDEERLLLHCGLFEPLPLLLVLLLLVELSKLLVKCPLQDLASLLIASFLIQSIYLCPHFVQTGNCLPTL